MAAKMGLWIDHRHAVIVSLADDGAKLTPIKSNVEKHIRAAGDPTLKGSFKARMVPADDRHEKAFDEHIKKYYAKITEIVCSAEAIYIFGPGEAKNELRKQLEKNKLGAIIVGCESADEMTDNEVLAKVCKFFNVPVPTEPAVESSHQRMKAPMHRRQGGGAGL
jgi:hypothetical protein